jgi:hypothetical protein
MGLRKFFVSLGYRGRLFDGSGLIALLLATNLELVVYAAGRSIAAAAQAR